MASGAQLRRVRDPRPAAGSSAVSVGRALDILQILAGDRHGLRLAEVAARLGADRANALRILGTMERRGFVLRDPISERYKLTFLVTSLGYRHLEAAGIDQWAQPILDALATRTRELVRLTVAEPDGLRWIARAQGADAGLIVDPDQGNEVALHATASGKAWLAELPDDRALGLVARRGLASRTGHTITDLERLRDDLARVRERGYGLARQEAEIGIVAIAVAIVRDGQPLGTVSVAAPSTRATPQAIDRWLAELRRAAEQLARLWGPYVSELIPRPGPSRDRERS
jgi:IclR family acetate operon transcriptional repressor